MTVGKISHLLSAAQVKKLADARMILRDFYEGNDDSFTWALAGLLGHLLSLGEGNVWAKDYVQEKVDLVDQCVSEAQAPRQGETWTVSESRDE